SATIPTRSWRAPSSSTCTCGPIRASTNGGPTRRCELPIAFMSDDVQDTLTTRLLSDKSKRPRLLSDCERLIDDEVKSKGGLSGLAIKGAYKIVCAIKPGLIREAMDGLLD